MAAVVVESAQTLMGLWIVGDICSCELRRQLKDLLLRVSRQGREKVGDKGQVVHSCSHSSARMYKQVYGYTMDDRMKDIAASIDNYFADKFTDGEKKP